MDGRLKVIEHLNQTLFFFDIAYEKSLDAELELLNRWKESKGVADKLSSLFRGDWNSWDHHKYMSTIVSSVEYLQIFMAYD